MYSAARIRQDFSAAATHYDKHASLQQRVRDNLLARAGRLPSHACVLDVGCGTGALARSLDAQVLQLDMAYAMCMQASQQKPAVNGMAEALPFADGAFDAVFSSLMLQWTPEPHTTLREMQRVLKPGGLFAVSTFGRGTLTELEQSFAHVDGHPHISAFTDIAGAERETITEYYPDVAALMRQLKVIGARNKLVGQRKSLMTPRQMQAVEQHYRRNFLTPRGLRVTWNVLYLIRRI